MPGTKPLDRNGTRYSRESAGGPGSPDSWRRSKPCSKFCHHRQRWTNITLEGDVAAAGNDFEALYDLFRLAYSDKIDEPAQLKLWEDGDR